MQVAPIPVFRPSYLMDGDEFQGDLVESPANIFYQKVNASRATLNRMQFQWRSPSDNLLASPVMFLRTTLKITCPQLWSQVQAYINVHGVLGPNRVDASLGDGAGVVHGTISGAGAVTPAKFRGQKVAAICFADGDAFTSCCSSINFLFNGTSLGLNRTNRWFRDFCRTQLSSDDAAKIYKSSGGRYDQKDQKGVAGVMFNGLLHDATGVLTPAVDAAAEAGCLTVAGITQDSGVSDRCRAFYSLLQDGSALNDICPSLPGANAAAQTFTARFLQVSFPVPISPLNPWRGAAVPASCPYRKGPLAIPHLSAGGLDFLMEDFAQSFIRRLGRTQAVSTSGAGHIGANTSNSAVQVDIVENKTYLEIKYFRLSHTRALKESYRWNVWQAQTFNGRMPPSAAGEGHENAKDGAFVMTPIGKDIATGTAAASQMQAAVRKPREWNIVFDVINLAQIPSYLLISVPRLAEQYSLAVEHVDMENCQRNLSHNLSIKNLKIIVNSARGAIDPSTDDTGFIDAERLWEMTKENATSEYFKAGGFRAWRDYQCAVLLHSSQFAPGLQSCDGVAYPVQIQIELTVQNRAVDVCALGIQGKAGATTRAHCLSVDYIRGRAQATAIFTKLILATSETSGSTNYMSYPLDSSERLMNSAGALR